MIIKIETFPFFFLLNLIRNNLIKKFDSFLITMNMFFCRVESPPVEENIPLTTQNPPDIENKPRVLFTGLASIKDFAKVCKY